jgi:DNA (cytosine-5)-methyltransferase 1
MGADNINIFSFFSGVGFLDLGFESSGYKTVFVNEYHQPFLEAYKHARKHLHIEEPENGYLAGDIQQLVSGSGRQRFSEQVRTVKQSGILTGFIGGPPCPDFSVAGKNKGRYGDNGKLSAIYINLIVEQKPDFFLFENVKGLWKTKRHRAFYEELKRELHEAGYCTTERLINAIEYGVPQDRERLILIGFHESIGLEQLFKEHGHKKLPSLDRFPWKDFTRYHERSAFNNYDWPATESFEENSKRLAPEGIALDLTVEHWFRENDVENHPNGLHGFSPRAGLSKFKIISEGDDSRKSYKRLHRWRYSPTAAYGNNEVHLHPYKARRISAAEALAIQSLPADFHLPEDMSLTNMFKTIGNGVPYLAARGLAESIKSFLGCSYEADSSQFSESHWKTTKEPVLQLHQFA